MHKGIKYVVTPAKKESYKADFLNTGRALTGILRNEELQDFIDRQPALTERHMQENHTLYSNNAQAEYLKKRKG